MRSRAALKFNNLHPESVKHFRKLFQCAKLIQEFPELYLDPSTSQEILNMLRNGKLSRYSQQDVKLEKMRQKKICQKKVSWSQHLKEDCPRDFGMEL